jgi:hypothetical protein
VVGSKVVDAEVLDPLYCGLQASHACRGGLPGSPSARHKPWDHLPR